MRGALRSTVPAVRGTQALKADGYSPAKSAAAGTSGTPSTRAGYVPSVTGSGKSQRACHAINSLHEHWYHDPVAPEGEKIEKDVDTEIAVRHYVDFKAQNDCHVSIKSSPSPLGFRTVTLYMAAADVTAVGRDVARPWRRRLFPNPNASISRLPVSCVDRSTGARGALHLRIHRSRRGRRSAESKRIAHGPSQNQ